MNTPEIPFYKVIVVGDSGVGKSCLLLRFADNMFTETHMSTIGIDFKIRTLNIDGKPVKLQIWDTAGQERFRTVNSSYYRGADGIVMVYDITEPKTFQNLKHWMEDINAYATKTRVAKILIGNKCEQPRAVAYTTAKQFAGEIGVPYFETSAKKNVNVHKIFESLARLMDASKSTQNGFVTLCPQNVARARCSC
jgi:Ras-related protein Rab-1A